MSTSDPSAAGYGIRRTLAPTGSPPGERRWRRHLIMVIDDSLAVRRVVEAVFARVGMDAVSFPDGMSAIRALASGDVPVPDVLLLDIGLPQMDGYDVARALRSNPDFRSTPIIMLTGHDGVFDRVRSRLAGARDFMPKPFRAADLVRRVQGHLGSGPELDSTH